MPGGDRTGPRGFGPRTGRRAGYCAGYDAPGYANPAHEFGMRHGRGSGGGGFGGWGRGGGYGWRHRYYATGRPGWSWAGYPTPTPEDEIIALKDEAEWLKGQLEAINQRITELSEE